MSTQSITIANSSPNPNGNGADMSRTGSNGLPNQATWTASDHDYQIVLPAAVWDPPPGQSLSFTAQKQVPSATYTLKSNAPTGLQGYFIAQASGRPIGNPPPQIMVEP